MVLGLRVRDHEHLQRDSAGGGGGGGGGVERSQWGATGTAGTHPQLHLPPGLLVHVDGVQLGPAHGLHVRLMTLPEVDHLRGGRGGGSHEDTWRSFHKPQRED